MITGLRLILSAADDPKIAAYLKKQTKDDQILLIDCSGGQYKIVPYFTATIWYSGTKIQN